MGMACDRSTVAATVFVCSESDVSSPGRLRVSVNPADGFSEVTGAFNWTGSNSGARRWRKNVTDFTITLPTIVI